MFSYLIGTAVLCGGWSLSSVPTDKGQELREHLKLAQSPGSKGPAGPTSVVAGERIVS